MSATTVLCPIDFSDESRNALRWARVVARRRQATLIVLHAVEPLLAEAARVSRGQALGDAETEAALREFVQATVPEVATALDRVTCRVRVGEPAQAILDEAAKERPLLVVMGTHGLGGFRKLLVGSTTERVLRGARQPVLAVPPSPDRAPSDDDPSSAIKRILVGTDFSPASMEALRWSAGFAREIGVPLLIAHIVVPTTVAPAWQSLAERADESRLTEARRRMDELSTEFPGLKVETLVALDRAEDGLAALAEERGAGMIVLGLSSEEGAFATHPGTIAYRVLCIAKALVLLVPRGA
jgi:nucleotide-binding universal stress UspA family protein